jgi:hypothetical protein
MASKLNENIDPNQYLLSPNQQQNEISSVPAILNEDDRLLAEMGYKQ